LGSILPSFTKSAVVGATPKTEFTPVFSPTDWASIGVADRIRGKLEAIYFTVEPFLLGGYSNQLMMLSIVPRPFGTLASAALSKPNGPLSPGKNWNASRLSFVGWGPLR
jgi:hypothetical protein